MFIPTTHVITILLPMFCQSDFNLHGESQTGRVMDDFTSESSAQLQCPSVLSVLGIKGALRFRRHGASQKAHVVLRRVEISEDAPYPPGRGPVAYFSLFAQKRIEVKPGKEILLSVASEDGSFTDQAVIFEGDLSVVPDSNSDEEEEVEKQIAHDDTFSDLPVPHVIPPKMRRTWTKHEQVSSVEGEHYPSPSCSIRPSIRYVALRYLFPAATYTCLCWHSSTANLVCECCPGGTPSNYSCTGEISTPDP